MLPRCVLGYAYVYYDKCMGVYYVCLFNTQFTVTQTDKKEQK